MTVTNTSHRGDGIHMMSGTKVVIVDVAITGCDDCALRCVESTSKSKITATRCEFSVSEYGALLFGDSSSPESTFTFTNCTFHTNQYEGLYGNNSTIHLHGEATAVHSNGQFGIYAEETFAKIIIHLPSHHNTSYNNKRDRHTSGGGTITNVED